MQTKRFYEEPTADITKLKLCDVITTSGQFGGTDSPAPDEPSIEQNVPDWRLPWD